MATNQPPQASLTGLPPELRNIIYNLVADDIKEANIIGRKLENSSRPIAAGNAQTHLWNAVAKHPLTQTCKLLRLEFDSIHQHQIISKGVDRCWLDLENFDLDRMGDLANLVRHMPTFLAHLRNECTLRVRLYIGKGAVQSVQTFREQSNSPNRLSRCHQKLQRVLNYPQLPLEEVKIIFRTNTMSSAQRRSSITQHDFGTVKFIATMVIIQLGGSNRYFHDHRMLFRLPSLLRKAQPEFHAKQRRARDQKALDKYGEELEDKLRLKFKSELKSELRQALAEQPETSKLDAVHKSLDED